MNKQLLLLCLLYLTISCSNEKEVPLQYGDYNYLKKEYNISKSGLILDGATIGIDTTLIFINGRINQKLWVGCYNKVTKAQSLEWVDNTELDTIFNLNTGYGNYSKFEINSISLKYPNYANGLFYFILNGSKQSSESEPIYTDLYIVKNNELLTKKRQILPAHNYFFEIQSWYKGLIVTQGRPFETSNTIYICYSATGDSLYSIDCTTGSKVVPNQNVEAVNYEECIKNPVGSLPDRYYKRYNLKSQKDIWICSSKPFKDIPVNARLDSTIIEKVNEIWKYSNYITYFDGSKTKVTFELNVESGELIINK